MVAEDPFSSGSLLLVVAHPDDEVIGAGGQFPIWRDRLQIVEVTDGSPGGDRQYAEARRQELDRALQTAGVAPQHCHRLGFRDQSAAYHLPDIVARLEAFRPDVVITHPYEGGHPDHDSCAFAVARAFAGRCPIYEFASYHAGPGGLETGCFLGDSPQTIRRVLNREQTELKQRMFACFVTQQQVLADFRIGEELFRPAPRYDFSQPPHPGLLHYENFDWGVTGQGWRELAAQALQLRTTHS